MSATETSASLPHVVTSFDYVGYERLADVWEFRYRLAGPEPIDLVEHIGHAVPVADQSPALAAASESVARLLFLAVGLSYYKAAAPSRIVLHGTWSAVEAAFLRELIANGLAEFAYVNDRPDALTPYVDFVEAAPREVASLGLRTDHVLTPIGGGKDSCVSLGVLADLGVRQTGFAVKGHRSITAVAEVAGVPLAVASRRLDTALLELNAAGALNGHVPVTAINSLVAALTALATGSAYVVMSNERSASEPNTLWKGISVNHQWSKSLEAERLLRDTLRAVVPELVYFSLLRPYSEIRIAEDFARRTEFHPVFTSCGRAFVAGSGVERWCLQCAKCRFVGLILAPFLGPDEHRSIFGADLFVGDPAPYLELAGIGGHKPLECVGEVLESRLIIDLAAARDDWEAHGFLPLLRQAIPDSAMPTDADRATLFAASDESFCPPQFRHVLGA